MKKAKYVKPKNYKKELLWTIKFLLTFACISLLGIFIYYGVVNGWESVVEWFKGKIACMLLVIFLFAGTLIYWVISIFKTLKKVTEDE